MPLQRAMSRTVGRSSSVRNPPSQRDCSAQAIPTAGSEPCFDTALPPMSSKQLVVATRRPQGGLERSPYLQHSTSIYGNPGGHRRTGSTLKTVMRKIFTRNRRSRTDEIDDSISDFRFGSKHASLVNRNGDRSPNPSNSGSSQQSSPPQQTTQPLATLDVVLKQLDTEPRQRRATLPSLIFSDDGSGHALETMVHPGKAPSTRKLSPHAKSDPDDVQRRQPRNIKRRSRSAGALRALAKEHRMSPIQWRRPRSVESDYGTSTIYGVTSESEQSSRPPTRTTVASAPKPSAEVSVFEEDEPEEDEGNLLPSFTPVLPPNVGELINSMQNDEDASLEQRLATLEVKLIDLEFAIARMQGGRADTPANSPGQKKTQEPAQHKRQKSSGFSPPSSGDDFPTENVPSTDRPLSTSTIRPSLVDIQRARALQAPSMVSLSDSGAISVQQYSALVMLLRREQTARRNLEQQVTGLQEDVESFRRMARDSIGVGAMYPIRSVESQEYLRLRPDDSPGISPRHTATEKIASRYESDSDRDRGRERTDRPKDDRFRPWQSTRRIEVANMI
ncbi:hypothetical protein BDW59DRAFT_133542 [Aspergillus cavernicola]|uniref:Uncharacterized protein n=1 Tax=Aspergillus cavernicola TaxID=176166 RepID=A0ABR4HP49_9EURO